MDRQTDVLICGVGPVGLCLAAQLQAMGVSYQIIDENPRCSEKSKALVVWGRSLELLNTCMDANSFLQAGRPLRKAQFFVEGVQFAEIQFSTGESEFGTGVLIPQNVTEKLVEEQLVQSGAAVQREIELASFEQCDDDVRCILKDSNGVPKHVVAKYLVGCDGAHSDVRHSLSLPFPGRKDGLRWVLADVELSGDVPDADVESVWNLAAFSLRRKCLANCGRGNPIGSRITSASPDPRGNSTAPLCTRRGKCVCQQTKVAGRVSSQ